jgi:hypothetical protein
MYASLIHRRDNHCAEGLFDFLFRRHDQRH